MQVDEMHLFVKSTVIVIFLLSIDLGVDLYQSF